MSKFSRYIRTAFICIVFLYFSSIISLLISGQTLASPFDVIGGKSGLSVRPNDVSLFNIENMYPGKEVSSMVTVRNEGVDDFFLLLSTVKEHGDDVLFHGLVVEISDPDNNRTYYRGSMSGVSNLNIEVFPAGEEERLNFTIIMSPEADKEYAGKSLAVNWVFTAVREQSGD